MEVGKQCQGFKECFKRLTTAWKNFKRKLVKSQPEVPPPPACPRVLTAPLLYPFPHRKTVVSKKKKAVMILILKMILLEKFATFGCPKSIRIGILGMRKMELNLEK